MDRGTRGRLKNQAGLQVYSDLESLGEKQNKNKKKKKETQVTHYDRVEGRVGLLVVSLGRAVALGTLIFFWGGSEIHDPVPTLYLLQHGVTVDNNPKERNRVVSSARRMI